MFDREESGMTKTKLEKKWTENEKSGCLIGENKIRMRKGVNLTNTLSFHYNLILLPHIKFKEFYHFF